MRDSGVGAPSSGTPPAKARAMAAPGAMRAGRGSFSPPRTRAMTAARSAKGAGVDDGSR